MTDETQQRRGRSGGGSGIVWPLILIAAGLLFLFDNLGVVNVDWWELWRLWPLLLVLGGLDLLLGGRSAIGNLAVAVVGLAVLGAVLYVVVTGGVGDLAATASRQQVVVEEALGGVELATLDVEMGSGGLWIEALDDSDMLIEAVLEVEGEAPAQQVARDGATARITLDQAAGER
ncbi:MAG: hypothetical protein JW767_05810, partial [Thermoleophilia bacterium]|nr:hypothetical protein [Thermoleophilia bacterium]